VIGWQVKQSTHKGFSGQLFVGVPHEHDEPVIYYANHGLEIAYRVSTVLAKSRKNFLFLVPARGKDDDQPLTPHGRISPNPLDHKKYEMDEFSSVGDAFSSTGQMLSPNRGSGGNAMKKSASVSGFHTPPKEPISYLMGSARSASSQSFIRALADDDSNVCSITSRKRLLTTTKVLIVWSDTPQSKQHNNLPQLIGSRALISIVIYPLRNGLFHVRIFKKPTVLLGPLTDDMVVNKHILGGLVRQTIVNACYVLADTDVPKPYVQRKTIIQDFIKLLKTDSSFNQFYYPYFVQPV